VAAPAMPAAKPAAVPVAMPASTATAAAAASEAAAETTADGPDGLLIQGFNAAAAPVRDRRGPLVTAAAAAVQACGGPRVARVPVPPSRLVPRSLRIRLAAARVRLAAALGLRTLRAPPACGKKERERKERVGVQ